MKKLTQLTAICAAAFALAACSSKTAKTETTETLPAKSEVAAAPTPAPVAQKETKNGKKIHAGKTAKTQVTETSAAAGAITCTSGVDSRVLEIKREGMGCELVYTKAGEAKSIASAKSEVKHCEEVSERISKKLQDAGYTCQ